MLTIRTFWLDIGHMVGFGHIVTSATPHDMNQQEKEAADW